MAYEMTCSRLLFGATTMLLAGLSAPAVAGSYQGARVRIGNGEAHTLVRTDANEAPISISVIFTPGMLEGLPQPSDGSQADIEFLLPMPASGPKTVVDHVAVNWNPHGHAPPHIYDAPHFDFHFYLLSEAERNSIAFADPKESGDPAHQPSPDILPAGYVVPPGTAVSKMGVHGVNLAAPEFKGQPFTATFIYGYHRQKLTFIEPMVTLAFLRSKPSFTQQVAKPKAYTLPGRYPASYSIRYDGGTNLFEVSLEDLN